MKKIKVISEHTRGVTSLIEIPGNKMISGSLDCCIKFWEITQPYLCSHTVDTGMQG